MLSSYHFFKISLFRPHLLHDLFLFHRHGKYSPGYMEVMRSWPKLRDKPDHPRKATDSNTISKHLLCLRAYDSRIREALQYSKFFFVNRY